MKSRSDPAKQNLECSPTRELRLNQGPQYAPKRRATGPRTPIGMQRSKYNATKHGILSQAVIARGESREQFQELLLGLRESVRPLGALEDSLTELLATLIWRYRRLLLAETAEVNRADPSLHAPEVALKALSSGALDGNRCGGPEAELSAGIQILRTVRDRIKAQGMDWIRDGNDLEDVFPCHVISGGSGINVHFKMAQSIDRPPESTRLREFWQIAKQKEVGAISDAEASQLMHEKLSKELDAFESLRNKFAEHHQKTHALASQTTLVPKRQFTDRLLRYQVTLERSIDRTLSQLERLQRMRLGKPLLPPIKVELEQT